MKKSFLNKAIALIGLVITPITFAAQNEPVSSTSEDNLLGRMELDNLAIMPVGISEKSDGTMIVTVIGNTKEDSSGQIWTTEPSGAIFSKEEISIGDKVSATGAFTSSTYSEARDSLFVCSIPNQTLNASGIQPSILEFKRSDGEGYVLSSVMNFKQGYTQSCKGTVIIGNRLFVVNPRFASDQEGTDPQTPAVYTADISVSNSSPHLEVLQTYSDLGYGKDPYSIAISDAIPAKAHGDNCYNLFLLDAAHSRIDSVTFTEYDGKLSRIGGIKEMGFDGSVIPKPTAMASLDDETFFIAALSGTGNNIEDFSSKIYRITYNEDRTTTVTSLIAVPSSPVGEMILSGDRFNTGVDKALFATTLGSSNNGTYGVSEYRTDTVAVDVDDPNPGGK